MFATFTGNSRRRRNVNLSGQKSVNPFTNPSWSGNTPVGASKTVAQAQVQRLQRQQERTRLKAAQRIQRVWRGYRTRKALRASRRQAFDQIYDEGNLVQDPARRTTDAIPLLLSVFQASVEDDCRRLCLLARDLLQTNFHAFTSGAIDFVRLEKLVRVLVSGLRRFNLRNEGQQAGTLLQTLVAVIRERPQSVRHLLGDYYDMLGNCCNALGPSSSFLHTVREAVNAPLLVDVSVSDVAYQEFALSFLTKADLFLFESNIDLFAANVDVDRLSRSLHANLAPGQKPLAEAHLLWLLGHFIALQKSKKQAVLHSRSIKVLYSLLSALSDQIRAGFASPTAKAEGEEDGTAQALPPYVLEQASSLTNRDEISGLLEAFAMEHGDGTDLENAGILAGYILTLISCFPPLGDDIRMRLYLADIPTQEGPLSAVKFFWRAASRTSVFTQIAADPDKALEVLREKATKTPTAHAETDSTWHREWRTILLFLELYIFVLRLTDDEDFFGALNCSPTKADLGSRLRSNGLMLADLKRLTLFLKHLGFTLYMNAADIQGSATSISYGQPSSSNTPPGFTLISGVDFYGFRALVTTATKMLYERDSRRQFLPQDHWLMTSKLDMAGFLQAVVLEEQRQRELADSDEEDNPGGSDEDEPMAFAAGAVRLSRHARIEKLRLMQKKAARERLREAVGPKLEILRNMPFVVPFDIRVQIFRQFVHLDKLRRRGGNIDPDRWRLWIVNQHGGPFDPSPTGMHILSRHKAQVQRGRAFADALDQFWDLKEGLKEPIQITFVDSFGMQEAGIDGGGVTKEFLLSVTTEAFTQDQKLFVTNSQNAFYPNPCALDQEKHRLQEAMVPENSDLWKETITYLLRQYEFLGRIIGKCLYEGILIDISFAGFFLLKWTSAADSAETYRANINDLRELDEELYQGMLQLKNYPGDVADLGLDFTITDRVSLPDEHPVRTVTRPLIPDGEKIPVTNENRPLYISYVARHRLVVQPYAQTRAFLRGLSMIIDPAWLSMFNQAELQRLVGGDSAGIDVDDLRRHTVYSGVYEIGDDGQEHPTVKLFWEVMTELSDDEKRDVLKYVTSSPRAPLLGFSQLNPPFSIRDGGLDEERLPSASTCVNLLKLPQYKTKEGLKKKLLYAVKSGAGFDLS